MRRLLLLVIGLVVGLVGLTVPAQAAGSGNPVITSPAPDSSQPYGWRGPITVDFTNAPVGSYSITLQCDNGAWQNFDTVTDESTTSLSYSSSEHLAGRCDLNVSSWGSFDATSFTVASTPPPPALTTPSTSVNTTAFYPRVVDGYLDTVQLTYRLNRSASVIVSVLNANGAVVRNVGLGSKWAGAHLWRWNGRRADGSLLPLGKYRFRVTATGGTTKVGHSAWFSLATKQAWVRKRITKDGHAGAARTSGSCYIEKFADEGTAHLDCWWGNYAQMTYGFRIPASARNTAWSVSGETSPTDICCAGSIRRWGNRPSSTSYSVKVKVTEARAYLVYGVSVAYTYLRTY